MPFRDKEVKVMSEQLYSDFFDLFGDGGRARKFFAPGRVNLIGEHTDYNGGHVFPCALSVGTYVIARKRSDQLIRLYSKNKEGTGTVTFSLNELTYIKDHSWANYPKGVIREFKERGEEIPTGFDAMFYGDIPNSAGLSSSASIELATAIMLNNMFGLDIEMIDMVKLCQQVENKFIGVNCGIMDQYAVGMGKKDHAILLNCQTLKKMYSPLLLENEVLVIANTNKSRGLADSKYNQRRAECDTALKELQSELKITSLGELDERLFEEKKHLIKSEVIQRRAKHAVYENRRTLKAVGLLESGDLRGFGALMKQSHISLRDDYEVTGFELDTLVEAAWREESCIGARMTGAGFGGCTVNLVTKEKLNSFIEHVGQEYKKITGLTADFYTVDIGDGAREISEQM